MPREEVRTVELPAEEVVLDEHVAQLTAQEGLAAARGARTLRQLPVLTEVAGELGRHAATGAGPQKKGWGHNSQSSQR